MKQFKDVTALEIEVKGKSVPLNVVLHPYAVCAPGQNLVGTTIKKLVTVSTVTFIIQLMVAWEFIVRFGSKP